jgi:hypothetical protein
VSLHIANVAMLPPISETYFSRQDALRPEQPQAASSPRSAFASFRSRVSNPSVDQP